MAYSPQNPRFCKFCRKALKACLCKDIPSLEAPYPTTLLVHPDEIYRSQSTGWLTHRMLAGSEFRLADSVMEIPPRAAILFPSKEAKPWNQVSFEHLILLDGTWDECRGMLQDYPQLQVLPQVRLLGAYCGCFIGRRAPWEGALSTMEALSYFYEEKGFAQGQQLRDMIERLNARERQHRPPVLTPSSIDKPESTPTIRDIGHST